MKNIAPDYQPRRNERILAQTAAGTVVLLGLDSGQYYSLDEIGGRVWAACDGRHTASSIAALLVDEYEAPMETVFHDVLGLLTDLANENLVHQNSPPVDHG